MALCCSQSQGLRTQGDGSYAPEPAYNSQRHENMSTGTKKTHYILSRIY